MFSPPPPFICWSLRSRCDCIWRWGLCSLGHEDGALVRVQGVYKIEAGESLLPLCPLPHQNTRRGWPSPKEDSPRQTPDLLAPWAWDFPASRTVRSPRVWCKPPIRFQQPEMTKTDLTETTESRRTPLPELICRFKAVLLKLPQDTWDGVIRLE